MLKFSLGCSSPLRVQCTILQLRGWHVKSDFQPTIILLVMSWLSTDIKDPGHQTSEALANARCVYSTRKCDHHGCDGNLSQLFTISAWKIVSRHEF